MVARVRALHLICRRCLVWPRSWLWLRAEYTNTNYIVLGGIVEAVSGQGVELLLQSRISAKAGLTSTSFTVTRNSPRFAHPYETQVV